MAGRRTLALVAATLAAVTTTPTALEAQTEDDIVIGDFTGPAYPRIRSAVGRAFRGQTVSPRRWSSAIRRLGEPTSTADYGALLDDVRAAALIEGTVERGRSRWAVELVVRNGADGAILGRVVIEERTRARLQRRLQRSADEELAPLLARAEVRPVPPPEPGGAKRLVVVQTFEGRGATRLENLVRGMVDEDEGFEVVEAENLPPADVDAYLSGTVDRPTRRTYTLTLRVTNGADGRTLDEAEFSGRNLTRLRRAVSADLWARIGIALGDSESRTRRRPPPPPPAARDSDDGAFDDDDTDGEPGEHGLPALEVSVGIQFLNRDLTYNDDLFGALRPYDLPLWPFISGELQIYPFAFINSGPFSHLGLVIRGDGAPGLSSEDTDGRSFPTSAWGLSVLLRGRLPIGTSELGVVAGYGVRNFRIEPDASENDPDVPATEYGYLELGADTRINLVENLYLTARASYLLLTATGELGSDEWFPRNQGGGLDSEIGAAYHLLEGLEIRGSVLYRRFWFSMNPEVGDTRVAGGAVDQYFGGSVSLAWRFVPGG